MDKRQSVIVELPHLMRYARALKRNPELADDLVQGTVERALAHLHQFKAGTNMRAWMFTIMHNLHAQDMRKLGRSTDTVPLDPAIENRHAAGPGQEARIMARDMERSLDALPNEQRDVILLVCLEDMSYTEAAEVLGVPIGTIMSRLARGRDRLRQFMDFGVPALRTVK